MRMNAGMGSRVAQAGKAGRHHQQSVDDYDEDDGNELEQCSTYFVSGSKYCKHN